MSVNASSVVWRYFPDGGALLVLALALADEADDFGAGIVASLPHLAQKSRQSTRAVQKQLHRMTAAGLLELVKQGGGGRGRFAEYRINLARLVKSENALSGPVDNLSTNGEESRTPFTFPEPEKMNAVHLSGLLENDHHIKGLKALKPTSRIPEHVAVFAFVGEDLAAKDRELAAWMLGKIRTLNPKHRDPPWHAWCTDIRLMRERDKRSHREIAELFAWANANDFWRANILSPATLRKQWDRLAIKRDHPGETPGTPTSRQPSIICSNCRQRVTTWTGTECDPCWRKSQGIEARA